MLRYEDDSELPNKLTSRSNIRSISFISYFLILAAGIMQDRATFLVTVNNLHVVSQMGNIIDIVSNFVLQQLQLMTYTVLFHRSILIVKKVYKLCYYTLQIVCFICIKSKEYLNVQFIHQIDQKKIQQGIVLIGAFCLFL